ncbi:four-carbon acid sugar kinase family protein [Bradyrhizobium sp. CB3481]|uniref:four-carbon acid sugar kinase family protein n=1 Tax=Bradyrhizobium sp. CB3481 TaxID=3039158 RepID=UPI0024B27DF4|nr:four-carbon acid sugar kinase family protein [Bradyrhizobium sp. CB3481]WFU19985.1 four-carbon acid sugar kinase family protein [Bradyrhizobium sp. CB3481]
MSTVQATRPRFGWYGDDFTGATDTLATWAEHGYRALLFLRAPTAAQLAAVGPLDAIGLAGATRAMLPTAAKIELDKAGCLFAALGVELLHYKCCSTFDSAPDVGSIGIAVQTLRRHFPNALLPIIGGQPNLGRYCLFGHLFAAAGTGGTVHRIDRHPTMSVHPVTPMGEADLRRHLAAQGLQRVAMLDYRAYQGVETSALLDACLAEQPEAVLFDVAAEADLAVIGRLIADRIAAGPMLAVGPSSVARALAAASDMRPTDTPVPGISSRRDGAVLALVGSLSPVTRAQVEAAEGYQRIDVDPVRLLTEFGYLQSLRRQAEAGLAAGNVMMVTDPAQAAPAQMERVAAATGMLLSAVLSETQVSRVVVAGGDTSSHAVAALDIWGLSYRAAMVPGAPLCRVHSDDPRLDGLDIILKGGQMGPPSFFVDAARR